MKKFFVFAAAAAFALCACEKTGPQADGSDQGGENNNQQQTVAGVVYNELDGHAKFIELYNTTDKEVSLEGVYVVKYDVEKDGGKSTTWTGAAGMKIAAKGYVVLESFDLCDDDEDGVRDNDYKYESDNHVFKGGLSAKKNVKFELCDAAGNVLDTFVRGEEGSAGWNNSKISENKECSYSRVPDGTGEWAYALPTKGAANGAKVEDMPAN